MDDRNDFSTNIRKGDLSDSEILKQLLFVCVGEGTYSISDIRDKIEPLAESMGMDDVYHKLRSVLQECMGKRKGTKYNCIRRVARATYAIENRYSAFC